MNATCQQFLLNFFTILKKPKNSDCVWVAGKDGAGAFVYPTSSVLKHHGAREQHADAVLALGCTSQPSPLWPILFHFLKFCQPIYAMIYVVQLFSLQNTVSHTTRAVHTRAHSQQSTKLTRNAHLLLPIRNALVSPSWYHQWTLLPRWTPLSGRSLMLVQRHHLPRLSSLSLSSTSRIGLQICVHRSLRFTRSGLL